MGFLDRAGQRQTNFDIDPAEGSPLAVIRSSTDRDILYSVQQALHDKRMRLAFQPAVYAADTSIIGFYEGYIRLLDAQGQVIPAGAFMGVAETQPLGREIDVAALRLGLQTLARNPGIRVAVNMSARSVGYKPFGQALRHAIAQDPQIARGLILEINEASAMQMPDMLLPFMAEWRPHGLTFTLDDFGADTTSLPLLNAYNFDIAKLDKHFIRNCHARSPHQPIIRAAIAMAREFGMFLVAEAVETADEANWLADQGIGCLQGYLFGRPEVRPDFTAFRHGRPPP